MGRRALLGKERFHDDLLMTFNDYGWLGGALDGLMGWLRNEGSFGLVVWVVFLLATNETDFLELSAY